jgi:hypothetical protein
LIAIIVDAYKEKWNGQGQRMENRKLPIDGPRVINEGGGGIRGGRERDDVGTGDGMILDKRWFPGKLSPAYSSELKQSRVLNINCSCLAVIHRAIQKEGNTFTCFL